MGKISVALIEALSGIGEYSITIIVIIVSIVMVIIISMPINIMVVYINWKGMVDLLVYDYSIHHFIFLEEVVMKILRGTQDYLNFPINHLTLIHLLILRY